MAVMKTRSFILVGALILHPWFLRGQDNPPVTGVEAQPLLVQVHRVDEALAFLGEPLPEAEHKALAALQAGDGEKVASEVQRLLHKLSDLPIGPALKIGFLKSLMRARYAVEPLGHYGLAKKKYAHFTSPIRRYADLWTHRVIKAHVRGEKIAQGDGIFAVNPAANRDPHAFPNPNVLDITRDASSHVTFGYGIHSCLGQGLARIELQVVFGKLFQRFPDLRLAEAYEQIAFKYDSQIYGLKRLMVAW